MNKPNTNILQFYLLATTLKQKIRQGSIYWNVTTSRRESIAEHIYDTCILAIAIHSEYNLTIDIQKVITMLVIHELEEVIIGDITPFDNVSDSEKLERGKKAVMSILSNLNKKEDYIKLTDEFNARQTKEAKFAYLCDKLDFDIQMKLYYDSGYIKIDPNLNTPVYKSHKIQKMIADGNNTADKIFYLNDVDKYNKNEIFKSLLDDSYSINLDEFLKTNLNDIL